MTRSYPYPYPLDNRKQLDSSSLFDCLVDQSNQSIQITWLKGAVCGAFKRWRRNRTLKFDSGGICLKMETEMWEFSPRFLLFTRSLLSDLLNCISLQDAALCTCQIKLLAVVLQVIFYTFLSFNRQNKTLSTSQAEESTEMIKNELVLCLENSMERLQSIWDVIGITESQKEDRTQVVLQHLQDLLREMVNEEDELRKTLLLNVETCSRELAQLSEEMGVPYYEVSKIQMSLLTTVAEQISYY